MTENGIRELYMCTVVRMTYYHVRICLVHLKRPHEIIHTEQTLVRLPRKHHATPSKASKQIRLTLSW